MMTKISTTETETYNGELRKVGDDREAQILYEYDNVYSRLDAKAKEHNLDLPPLFKKNFTDHRALTGHDRNIEASQANLQMFLNFLDSSGLYDLLVPASSSYKGRGYKVNPNDPRIPREIKVALNNCTQTFRTTEDHKPVRRRFLDASKLDQDIAEQLEAKVSELLHTYESWLERRVMQIKKQRKSRRKQFSNFYSGAGSKRFVS